jgi:hypothetical protein
MSEAEATAGYATPEMLAEDRKAKAAERRATRRQKRMAAIWDRAGGKLVEIEEVRAHEKRLVMFTGTESGLSFAWQGGAGPLETVEFSLTNGCGRGTVRYYRITDEGAKVLGLTFKGESATVRHWLGSVAAGKRGEVYVPVRKKKS